MIIRSLIFRLFCIIWTLLMPILALPVSITSQKNAAKVSRIWAYIIIRALKALCNVTIEVRGRENIPTTSYIMASKHQSALETIYFVYMLNNPAFILKRELLWIPVYGVYLFLLKMVWIDRSSGIKSIKKIIAASRLLLNQGRPLVIFPEGTRVPIGEKAKFLPGISAISRDMPHIPIVPVALNSGVFMPKKRFIIKPGVMVVQILPPLPGYSRGLVEDLQERINQACEELLKPYSN